MMDETSRQADIAMLVVRFDHECMRLAELLNGLEQRAKAPVGYGLQAAHDHLGAANDDRHIRPNHSYSRRELAVLRRLAAGLSNAEIARDLTITGDTVKFHIKNIYFKLGVQRRIHAIQEAHRLGLVQSRSLDVAKLPRY